VIRLRDVSLAFGSGSPVLAGVDLEVPAGTLYGLVGPGASGKSVVLKIVASLLQPDAGTVVVRDRDLATLDEETLSRHRTETGMVFQNNALFDFMTVADNVAFPLRRLTRLGPDEIARRVEERLARVGLGGFGHRMPSGLSGGQKRRVGLARATVLGPPVILYDEPAAGLDPVASQRIFDLLREEQLGAGTTALMVSSDIDRLLSVTDRVGVLFEGRIVFEGSTDEARSSSHPVVRQLLRGDLDGPL
jgi:phospholipid/cholesterol/gamma-HCH transport system ATP-binding protein